MTFVFCINYDLCVLLRLVFSQEGRFLSEIKLIFFLYNYEHFFFKKKKYFSQIIHSFNWRFSISYSLN